MVVEIFFDVTKLHKIMRDVLDTSSVLAEINYHGWLCGVGGRLDQMKLRLTQPGLGFYDHDVDQVQEADSHKTFISHASDNNEA